jgi:phosphodiesterase/alkaline phosphatase D-like protein
MIRGIIFCLIFQFAIWTVLTSQIVGPYLQSPTDTSIWITWKTDSNPETRVIYGADSALMQYEIIGTCEVLSDIGYDNNYFYHSVRLTGLEPENFYYYRVITGSLQSAIYRFRTQPSYGINSGIYRILILGDHQLKDNDH